MALLGIMKTQYVATPREAVEACLRQAPRTLRYDIAMGEQMLTAAEKHLPALLETDPAFWLTASKKLQKIWRNHILGVLIEGEEYVAKHEPAEYRREYLGMRVRAEDV